MILYFYIVGFVLFLIFFLFLLGKRRKKFSSSDVLYVKTCLAKISDGIEANPAFAVLEADKLVDFCLAKSFPRYKNLSFGEKLKRIGHFFSDIDGLWSAHKLRNKIAHEVSFRVSRQRSLEAVNHFKKALKDLGVL